MTPNSLLLERTLHGAGMWSAVISRGKRLRLTDIDGGANVGMLLYNALERTERYNMPDTLKGQHIFYLRAPYCLHSDMGRLLASITDDTVGWHDTVCGHSDAARVLAKYGANNYQQARNDWNRNGRDCFLIELAKWGLGKKDLVPNLNLFSKVVSDEEGHLSFVPENSKPGDSIELRFEIDTLVVLNTCQHPLDPDPVYRRRHVQLEVFSGDPAAVEDPSLAIRPENQRAWENNETYHTLPLLTAMTESTLIPENAVFREVIPAGDWWVHEVKKGQTLRILDLEGNQAADTLFFSAAEPTERYSADRTIQEQSALYLTTGTQLMSNEGNALLTITADTCGRHDTLGGACSRESNTMRYAHDTECMHACRDIFIRGAQEWNIELTKRDLPPNINFFMNVPVSPDGGLTFADGISAPGRYVEMVAEMDVICLISNCPQLNNPCNGWNPTPVEALIFD